MSDTSKCCAGAHGKHTWDCDVGRKTPSELAPAQCSVASFKADLAALKEQWGKRWWHDKPNNGDLKELIIIVDKLVAVVERLEKQMPPND